MSYQLLTYFDGTGPRAGLRSGDRFYDAARATGEPAFGSVLEALNRWSEAERAFDDAARRIAAGVEPVDGLLDGAPRLLAPVLLPGAVYCAGANYYDHVREMDRAHGHGEMPTMKALGEPPWFFMKNPRSCIVGPGASVALPAGFRSVDWEVELVAVIGRTAKQVSVENALDHVAGYTIANDLSARDALLRPKVAAPSPFRFDWVTSKSFDGSCPLGPWITPAREVPDPQALGIKLWVDGETMQDSSTGQMIFSVAEQIAAISARTTLYPGDLVLTGTPAGVGMARKVFLRSGQVIKMWIEEIGELEHRMA